MHSSQRLHLRNFVHADQIARVPVRMVAIISCSNSLAPSSPHTPTSVGAATATHPLPNSVYQGCAPVREEWVHVLLCACAAWRAQSPGHAWPTGPPVGGLWVLRGSHIVLMSSHWAGRSGNNIKQQSPRGACPATLRASFLKQSAPGFLGALALSYAGHIAPHLPAAGHASVIHYEVNSIHYLTINTYDCVTFHQELRQASPSDV